MQFVRPARLAALAAVVVAVLLAVSVQEAPAYSHFYASRCGHCHGSTPTTCDGCHYHKGMLSATAGDSAYAPGSLVTVTLSGGTAGGWVRGILYDDQHQQVDLEHQALFPVVLQAHAPAHPGEYVWSAAWFGASNTASSHLESAVPVTIRVAVPLDVPEEPSIRQGSWGRIRSLYRD